MCATETAHGDPRSKAVHALSTACAQRSPAKGTPATIPVAGEAVDNGWAAWRGADRSALVRLRAPLSTLRVQADAGQTIALPPPSRRVHGSLRCAASAAPLRAPARAAPATTGRPWPSSLSAALRPNTLGVLPRVCLRRRCPRTRRCQQACSVCDGAAHPARLPLRSREPPPSPYRAETVRCASRPSCALTGLWAGKLDNAPFAPCCARSVCGSAGNRVAPPGGAHLQACRFCERPPVRPALTFVARPPDAASPGRPARLGAARRPLACCFGPRAAIARGSLLRLRQVPSRAPATLQLHARGRLTAVRFKRTANTARQHKAASRLASAPARCARPNRIRFRSRTACRARPQAPRREKAASRVQRLRCRLDVMQAHRQPENRLKGFLRPAGGASRARSRGNPRRIEAAGRRRANCTTGHSLYANNNPYKNIDPDGRQTIPTENKIGTDDPNTIQAFHQAQGEFGMKTLEVAGKMFLSQFSDGPGGAVAGVGAMRT